MEYRRKPTISNNSHILCQPVIDKSRLRFGEKNSNWKGGQTIHEDGHILVRSPNHPHVNANGYVLRSRLVMEEHLGRYLEPGEIVHHHKDKDDDRIENLKLFPSISEHMSFHWQERRLRKRF